MSYETENLKDNVRHDMFIVISPRYRIESWTLHSGSVYRASFSKYVTGVSVNGTALTQGSSAALSAGQFWYDLDEGYIYIRHSDSGAPVDSDWNVVTYELHLSTWDGYWHRVPTDSNSEVVYWRSLITQTPVITRSSTDTIFGFSPVESTSVVCVNDPEYFQEVIHSSSFNNATAVIYHSAGDIKTENIEKIFTGLSGDYSFKDRDITFSILDKTWKFYAEMNNGSALDKFEAEGGGPDGAGADVAFAGRAIRSIYGMAYGIRAICTTAQYDSPTSSHNRKWAFITNAFGTNVISATVTGVSTTHSFSISASDAQKIIRTGLAHLGINGAVKVISSIDETGSIGCSSHGASVGNTIYLIPFLAAELYLLRESIWYKLTYGSDYTLVSSGNDTYGIQLTSTVESSRGISAINPQTDMIVAPGVLGIQIAPTINGSTFGSPENPITVLYHILKDRLGLSESEIDTDAFLSIANSTDVDSCDVIVPPSPNSENFPTYNEVITRLLTTAFLRAYVDKEGRFTISQIGPLADTPDIALTDDDIESPEYSFSHGDLARISVHNTGEYVHFYKSKADASASSGSAPILVHETQTWKISELIGNVTSSDANSFLHNAELRKEIDTYTPYIEGSSELTAYKARYASILGDRRGYLTCIIKTGGHSLELGDTVEITRKKQPGFSYDGETENSRKYVVTRIRKERSFVEVVLDDQKGIEENADSW